MPNGHPSPDESELVPELSAQAAPDCIELSGSARALFEALAEIRQELANTYLGALDIAARPGNPDYLALAAHGIRELIEKLPRHLDVPVDAPDSLGLTARVRNLTDAWNRLFSAPGVNLSGGDQEMPAVAQAPVLVHGKVPLGGPGAEIRAGAAVLEAACSGEVPAA